MKFSPYIKLSLGLLFIAAGFSSSAETTRYIVQMRSSGAFKAAHAELLRSLRTSATKTDAFGRIHRERPRLFNTNAQISEALDNLDMLVVSTGNSSDIEALRANPNVLYVEQEQFYEVPVAPLASRPRKANLTRASDAELPWGIKAVKAPEAWQYSIAGGPSINSGAQMGQGARVVILDTGIDKDHSDLKNRFESGKNFVNSINEADSEAPDRFGALASLSAALLREIPGNPGNPDFQPLNPPAYEFFDQNGHGTHVAGTVAGELDNNGVVGVAPKARILAGRVCGKFGCSTISIVNGINWAITQKADIISMSLGGPTGSQSQQDALAASERAGIVNIAASGNSGTNKVSFPGAYDTVLGVGATDQNSKRASFSQWGPELDVVAPGVDVKSSVPRGMGRESIVKVGSSNQLAPVVSSSFVGSPELDSPLVATLALAGLGKPEDFAGQNFSGKIALIQRGEIPFADKVKNAIAAGAAAALIYNNAPGLISGALTQDGSVVAIPASMIEQSVGEDLASAISGGAIKQAMLKTEKVDFASFQGTSMATPHVAGVAALVKAINKNLSPAQVRQIITSTSTAPNEQTVENEYGAGVVNAQAAVQAAIRSLPR